MKFYAKDLMIPLMLGALGLAAYAATPAGDQAMPHPQVLSQIITVQHIRIISDRTFNEARLALEMSVPKLDPSILEALSKGDQSRVAGYENNGPPLSIFLERDHGSLLQTAGKPRNAIQFEIGNPVTATKMTRYQLAAALYAPLRVVLYENEQGNGVFEYDKPSSQFGQYGDLQVAEIGLRLGSLIESTLQAAAGTRG